MKIGLPEFAIIAAVVAVLGGFGAFIYYGEKRHMAEANEKRTGHCFDASRVIATTAGSPDDYTCPNIGHRMRLQPVTKAGEEIGAVVFCECQREEKKP